ncbi:Conserved_hypothetical protein [Hexamita inflata]|uniref:Uncharacterized protein n=1 Tax=Hexamita inflata TaxID=28002 RepID=A0ABP1HZI3_9EUKA
MSQNHSQELIQHLYTHNQLIQTENTQNSISPHIQFFCQRWPGMSDVNNKIAKQLKQQRNQKNQIRNQSKVQFKSIRTSSLADMLIEDDNSFLKKLSAKITKGCSACVENGLFAVVKKGKIESSLGYEGICGVNKPCDEEIQQIPDIVVNTLTEIPFVPFVPVQPKDQEMIPTFTTLFVQQVQCQQRFNNQLFEYHKQTALILATECKVALEAKQKSKRIIKQCSPECSIIKPFIFQLEKVIEEGILQSQNNQNMSELNKDFIQQQTELINFVSHISSNNDLQVLMNEILVPDRKKQVETTKAWIDFVKLCLILPNSNQNGELKLKHVLNEENMLSKSTLIYMLLALSYDSRYINVNLPIGSLKTIQNLIYYHSIHRHQIQKDSNSYIIYTAQDNLQQLQQQIHLSSQSCGYTIVSLDSQLTKRSNSNKRGQELKHELYQYDANSEFIKYNFFGLPERKTENVISFDRQVYVLIIAYEALKSESDAERQTKKFQEENSILKFDVGILHLPDKQNLTFQINCTQKIVMNSDLEPEAIQVCLNLIQTTKKLDIIKQMNDQRQQMSQLRSMARQFIQNVSYVPHKQILKQSLPQPKMEQILIQNHQSESTEILSTLKKLVQLFKLEERFIIDQKENIFFYITQLRSYLNSIQNDQKPQTTTKNIAECLKQDVKQFCTENLNKFLYIAAQKTHIQENVGTQLKSSSLFSLKFINDEVQQSRVQDISIKQILNRMMSPKKRQIGDQHDFLDHFDEFTSKVPNNENELEMHYKFNNTQRFEMESVSNAFFTYLKDTDLKKLNFIECKSQAYNDLSYPQQFVDLDVSNCSRRLQLVFSLNYRNFKQQNNIQKQTKTLLYHNQQKIIKQMCELIDFRKFYDAIQYIETNKQKVEAWLIKFGTQQIIKDLIDLVKFQNSFLFKVPEDVEYENIDSMMNSSMMSINNSRIMPNSRRQTQIQFKPIIQPVIMKSFTLGNCKFQLSQKQIQELVSQKVRNQYKDYYNTVQTQKILELVNISLNDQTHTKSQILIVTDTEYDLALLSALIKMLFQNPKKEIHVYCQINQYRLSEYVYSAIILLPSECNYLDLLKQTPTSCQQTIYQLMNKVADKPIRVTTDLESQLISACELIGTQQMLKKLAKHARTGTQVVYIQNHLQQVSKTLFKSNQIKPILRRQLQILYKQNYVQFQSKPEQINVYSYYLSKANQQCYKIIQKSCAGVGQVFIDKQKFIINVNQAETQKPTQYQPKKQTQQQRIGQTTTYVQVLEQKSKYQAFQQFRKKIDAIAYYYDDTKPEEVAQKIPLLLAINPLQRYFIPRCCVVNNFLHHLLYTIQESSRIIQDTFKLKLNGTYTIDLQQINFFLVHLQLYRDIFHGFAHPDVKQLIFLGQVFRKTGNISQRPNQQLQVFSQFVESPQAMSDPRKQNLRIQCLKLLESQQIYVSLKQQLQQKFKKDTFRVTQPIYSKYQENNNNEISHKTQTELIEQLMIHSKDPAGQLLYSKEDRLKETLERCFQSYMPGKVTDYLINEVVQRSCAPALSATFLIKKFKNESFNTVNDVNKTKTVVDFVKFRKSSSSFVNALMLGMRSVGVVETRSNKQEQSMKPRLIDWDE